MATQKKIIQEYVRAITRQLVVSAIVRLDAHERNTDNPHEVVLDQVVTVVSTLPPSINALNEGDWYIELLPAYAINP